MLELPEGYLVTGIATVLVVVVCVLLHYEGLRILSDHVLLERHHSRKRVSIMILSLLLLHILEIWIFGGAYFLLLNYGNHCEFVGDTTTNLFDCIYYSATVYTTIGFGDVVPTGAIRTMTGTEGLTGLTIITWSASYTFLEMMKTWHRDE